jgi:DNA gyrase subunit A
VIGRATQGVRLLKINEGDEISSVAKIENEDKAEEVSEVILNQSELPAEESLNPDLTDPDLINEN